VKLYVGNLAYKTQSDGLREAFAEFGEVKEAIVVTDKFSGQSRGFGFVEFTDDAAAQKAMQAMDGRDLDGRNLKVNEAKPRENQGGGGGGGGGRDRHRRDRDRG
jgi:RNA recognition motif-containing protein